MQRLNYIVFVINFIAFANFVTHFEMFSNAILYFTDLHLSTTEMKDCVSK